MKQRISIVAVNDCSGSALIGVVDLFHSANVIWKMLTESQEILFETQVISPEGQAVKFSNSYSFSVDGGLDLVAKNDAVICIPFASSSSDVFIKALEKQTVLIGWLRQHRSDFRYLGALSVGVFLLADAGLLTGKRVATAWWFDSVFKQRHPNIEVSTNAVCVDEGNVLSTGSANGYQDLCMKIVERVAGKSFAVSMSRYLMTDYERRSAAPEIYAAQIHSINPIINQADAWIQRNLANDIRVGEIAAHVAVSTRTLTRYFKSEFGTTPQQYIQNSRIEKGKLLLEITELDLAEIAYRCGYIEPGAFRRLFKKHCAVSPTAYRENCRMGTRGILSSDEQSPR